jgi:cytidine deaminase
MTAEQQALLAMLQKQQTQNQTVVNVGNQQDSLQPGVLDGMDKDAVRDLLQGFNTAYQVAFASAALENSSDTQSTEPTQQ